MATKKKRKTAADTKGAEHVKTLVDYLGKPAGSILLVLPHMRPKYEAMGLIAPKRTKAKRDGTKAAKKATDKTTKETPNED